MKNLLMSLVVIGAVFTAAIPALSQSEQTADVNMATESAEPLGTFTKKRYSLKGGWEISQIDGKTAISFTDDFKTKSGPDLKVYLSPIPIEDVTGKTATDKSVKIGVLKSNSGAQTYMLPDDVNISDFASVLVHCEAYSVLWGGFDIPK